MSCSVLMFPRGEVTEPGLYTSCVEVPTYNLGVDPPIYIETSSAKTRCLEIALTVYLIVFTIIVVNIEFGIEPQPDPTLWIKHHLIQG
jgi:hypothetical protein